MLCGILKPTSGVIEFDFKGNGDKVKIRQDLFDNKSDKLDKSKVLKSRIGIVPQDLAVYPRLTARENLEFFGGLYNIEKKELNNRIDNLLVMVGLKDRKNDVVGHYSTGMMRRLNLAAGLIHNPELILLDEPTVGIDPQSRNCIFDAVLRLRTEGVTILYTTHYMGEATKLCDNIAIMDKGRILIEDAPNELIRKYGLYAIKFRFESNADNSSFVKKINQLDGIDDFTVNGAELSIVVKRDFENIAVIDSMRDLAVKEKIHLTLVKIIEPDLESVFLDITGRALRDGTEDNFVTGGVI